MYRMEIGQAAAYGSDRPGFVHSMKGRAQAYCVWNGDQA